MEMWNFGKNINLDCVICCLGGAWKVPGRVGLFCFAIVLFSRFDTLCFEAWLVLCALCVLNLNVFKHVTVCFGQPSFFQQF